MIEKHRKAMALSDKAFLAFKNRGDRERAKELWKQAYEIEIELAKGLDAVASNEPTRCILFRSAAALANNAGLGIAAVKAARDGLEGEVEAYPYIVAGLKQEIKRAKFLAKYGWSIK